MLTFGGGLRIEAPYVNFFVTAYVAFYGYSNKNVHSHSAWYGFFNPFNLFNSNNGYCGQYSPFKWFGCNAYRPPTNAVINFVVENTVDAGATATATNENHDDDTISNTATNAGGKKRRRRDTILRTHYFQKYFMT